MLSIVVSNGGTANAQQIREDYRCFNGKELPFTEFGYSNLELFLQSHHFDRVIECVWDRGRRSFKSRPDPTAAHVQRLVAGQKKKSVVPSWRTGPPSIADIWCPRSFGQSYSQRPASTFPSTWNTCPSPARPTSSCLPTRSASTGPKTNGFSHLVDPRSRMFTPMNASSSPSQGNHHPNVAPDSTETLICPSDSVIKTNANLINMLNSPLLEPSDFACPVTGSSNHTQRIRATESLVCQPGSEAKRDAYRSNVRYADDPDDGVRGVIAFPKKKIQVCTFPANLHWATLKTL